MKSAYYYPNVRIARRCAKSLVFTAILEYIQAVTKKITTGAHMAEGSYTHEQIGGDHTSELERLKRQANTLQQIETKILADAGLSQAKKIIELGCGPGFATPLLAKIAPTATILAADYAWELISKVPENTREVNHGNIYPIQSKGNEFAVRDNWGDFAYCRFLLQHVPKPEYLIAETFRSLESGGKICIADSDDGLIVNYPQDERAARILNRAQTMQQEYGGDRFIGRKLPILLKQAGFSDIKSQVLMVTNTQIPFQALFGILFGYKAAMSEMADLKQQLAVDLEQACNNGDAMLAAGVFVVTATKP
ncbi:MAG: methyltransferase domain-containing protein [Chromatiales bacterium]|jgi:ubiquinone/menaquinone biosynthesis C-methylase UbiE